jgi:hypothetical protein
MKLPEYKVNHLVYIDNGFHALGRINGIEYSEMDRDSEMQMQVILEVVDDLDQRHFIDADEVMPFWVQHDDIVSMPINGHRERMRVTNIQWSRGNRTIKARNGTQGEQSYSMKKFKEEAQLYEDRGR